MKPAHDFNWHRREKGERDTYCRPCRAAYHRAHYLANRQKYIENANGRTRLVVRERTAYLMEFFRTHPCVDCGEGDPRVLEFDHLGEKSFNISAGIRRRPWEDVVAEIAKCEVRCANCHRRATAQRGGFLRALLLEAHDGLAEVLGRPADAGS
jgi:hypothetical protein